jgi:hypothetical protein
MFTSTIDYAGREADGRTEKMHDRQNENVIRLRHEKR